MKILAVFQPTPFCNLDCTYCWAPGKNENTRMSLSIFENALKQVLTQKKLSRLDILWLTGEPLIVGLEYYKSAVSICKGMVPGHLNLRFIVQTNGTLINDEWASFFKENDFTVGVSIDGPKKIHDQQRVNRSGNSSFELAINGINCLVKHGVKGGALCVITRNTLEASPDELFSFFHDRKLSWSYLIEAKIGENLKSDKALSKEDLPRLEEFLGRLMDLWGQFPDEYIRDFDQLARRMFGTHKIENDLNNQGCLDIVNVTAQGEFFWGNPELMSSTEGPLRHLRGQVQKDDIWEFRNSPGFKAFEEETHRGTRKCMEDCVYFQGCEGGNPAHKFYQFGRFDVSSHLTCEMNDKVIAELLVRRVEQGIPTNPNLSIKTFASN